MLRTALREVLWIFLPSRLLLGLLTYIGYILFTSVTNYTNDPVNIAGLLTSWNHGDASRYLEIARYGYREPADAAFFPLFPALLWLLSYLPGPTSLLFFGTLISNIAFFTALLLFYQLVEQQYQAEIAQRSILYLCLFPSALVSFTAYGDALALCLLAGTLLALSKQRWWLAGLLGMLTTLSTPAGTLVFITYIFSWWKQPQRHVSSLLPLGLVMAGPALFSVYCWQVLGDPLAALHHGSRMLVWPWESLLLSGSALFTLPFGSSGQARFLLDLAATLGFLALLIAGWRTLRWGDRIWMGLLLVGLLFVPSTLSENPLQSNIRFVLLLLPAFSILALLGKQRPWLHHIVIFSFISLQAVLSIVFLMGRWLA